MTTALLLFARLPREGRVKTRLAATLGGAFATAFYEDCAELVLTRLARVDGVRRVVFVADAGDVDAMREWVGPAWEVLPQAAGDLTVRLESAFNQVFREGAEAVVVTATDTPGLDAAVIGQARAVLAERDAVLVPATDGGYALLGLRVPTPGVFRDISWSTELVADQTRERLRQAGRTWGELSPLPDIDTEGDLRTWLERGDDPLRRRTRELLDALAVLRS